MSKLPKYSRLLSAFSLLIASFCASTLAETLRPQYWLESRERAIADNLVEVELTEGSGPINVIADRKDGRIWQKEGMVARNRGFRIVNPRRVCMAAPIGVPPD